MTLVKRCSNCGKAEGPLTGLPAPKGSMAYRMFRDGYEGFSDGVCNDCYGDVHSQALTEARALMNKK